MIPRALKSSVQKSLENFPVVGLVGARQVGKTTLAKEIAKDLDLDSVMLDLVLVRPGNVRPLGIEIKLTKAPVPSKGFWSALRDLDALGLVICSCDESYPLGDGS